MPIRYFIPKNSPYFSILMNLDKTFYFVKNGNVRWSTKDVYYTSEDIATLSDMEVLGKLIEKHKQTFLAGSYFFIPEVNTMVCFRTSDVEITHI